MIEHRKEFQRKEKDLVSEDEGRLVQSRLALSVHEGGQHSHVTKY